MAETSLAPQHLDALADGIRAELALAEAAFQKFVSHAIRCGELLEEVKRDLPHGEFKPWVAANFPRSYDTACAYRRIARERAKVERAQPSSLRQALAVVKRATDKPKREPYVNPRPV